MTSEVISVLKIEIHGETLLHSTNLGVNVFYGLTLVLLSFMV